MARKSASHGLGIYGTIWTGQTISNLGTGLGSFSLGVWLYQQTQSVTQFSGMMLAATLTALVLTPVAGSVADRVDRRRVLILCNLGSAVMTLLMVAALYTGRMQPWYAYIVAVVMTGLAIVQGPAFVASVSVLVPRHLLVRTSSLSQTAAAITGIAAPFLAGILIGRIGVHGVIFLDFCTFLIAALSVLIVRIPRPPASGIGTQPFWHDALLGWRYIRERPGLLSLLFLFGSATFSVGIVQALLTPLILSFATPQELGTVSSAGPAGLLLGGLILTLWGGPKQRVWGIFGALVAQALILFLGGLEPNVPLVTAAVFAFMLTTPFIGSGSQAIWQSKVALDLQGRVFAIRGLIASASLPLAYAVAGPLADRVFEPMLAPGGALAGTVGRFIGVGDGRGVGFLFMVLGAFLLALTLVSFLNPRLRNVETELPDATRPEEEQGAGPAEEAPRPEPSAARG
ncbi:MAG TPA: MFS transporter [Thermoanaerobaculia bacterium]|jgi:MFS family permease